MTPQLKPIKRGIAHGRFSYSESEKNYRVSINDDVPIFAYLRRSTNKKEQEDSLIQQEDGISTIVKRLGLGERKIRYFAETRSGFENRKRKEWGKMLEEIDKSSVPCLILCRDISRLSRNPTDGQKIMDRVYGDNQFKNKPKIAKIVSFDYENTREWSKNTDKEEMHKALSTSYYDSLQTKKLSIEGILIKLESGEFPYHPPKGLEHIVIGGKRMLKQNDKMPFVRHAFEMKVERRGHKEIVRYLKQYGDIKISYKELTDRYFTNTVYIGEYSEKTTGKKFTNLLFAEGKPPIALSLWDQVQSSLAKRGRIYRDASERDVFEEKGRTEAGGLLARYQKQKNTKKGTHVYTYYKNTKAKVNIAQEKILFAFFESIYKILKLWSVPYVRDDLTIQVNSAHEIIQNSKSNAVKHLGEYKLKYAQDKMNALNTHPERYFSDYGDEYMDFVLNMMIRRVWDDDYVRLVQAQERSIFQMMSHDLFQQDKNAFEKVKQEFAEETGATKEMSDKEAHKLFDKLLIEDLDIPPDIRETSLTIENIKKAHFEEHAGSNDLLREAFGKTPGFQESMEMAKARKQQIEEFEKQKKTLEDERRNYRRKAVNLGFSAEEIEETSKDIEKSIKLIEEQIQEFSENSDMEKYLERLPQVLLEIVELVLKSLSKGKIEEKQDNLVRLFELAVSNFSVSNKKELKIELFKVLEALTNDEKTYMEAPSGVEPDYRALQAPA